MHLLLNSISEPTLGSMLSPKPIVEHFSFASAEMKIWLNKAVKKNVVVPLLLADDQTLLHTLQSVKNKKIHNGHTTGWAMGAPAQQAAVTYKVT